MEQMVRDARINMIYEGANAIQALDLLGRKVLGDQGAKLKQFATLVQSWISGHSENPEMSEFIEPLTQLGEQVATLTEEVAARAVRDPEEVGAAAVDYLRVVGHWVYAYFWAQMAYAALTAIKGGSTDPFYRAKLATARFYFDRLLPETAYHVRAARAGANSLMALSVDLF